MRFTLTYRGKLSGNGDAKHKHQIRMELHNQLVELWRVHPALWGVRNDAPLPPGHVEVVGDRQFVSLVHPTLRAHAELDILVLWAGEENEALVSPYSGDLDNQLKTLLDALRRPASSHEIPASWIQNDDDPPLHCLLDDDKLVTRINVEVDRLLRVPASPQVYAEVLLRVTVRPYQATYDNLSLAG